MFTGIVETVGEVLQIKQSGTNLDLQIKSDISSELKIDQSISHNGVCLTVTAQTADTHWVTAIDETIRCSNFGKLKVGDSVNLERCMKADARFDGHIVQGHVDTVAKVIKVEAQDGSWVFGFDLSAPGLLVEKGSICINGASLTCFSIGEQNFEVAIIPYTFENTNFGTLQVGDEVNIEFDILGKYIQKMYLARN